jgi:hypothetical protein
MATVAMALDVPEVENESHSIPQSIALHLLPGILIGAVVFTVRGLVVRAGYPTLMALLLAIPVSLIPFELGVLVLIGKRRNGRFSLDGIVHYRDQNAHNHDAAADLRCPPQEYLHRYDRPRDGKHRIRSRSGISWSECPTPHIHHLPAA